MARLVAVALAVSFSLISGAAVAADRSPSPWRGAQENRPISKFAITSETDLAGSRSSESPIIAGKELFPNTTIGFGMFGQKAEKSPHTSSTARELAIPKSRRAAVGLSLKF